MEATKKLMTNHKETTNIKTYIANHDLLTWIRLHVISSVCSPAVEPVTTIVVHPQTTAGRSLLVRTRIVGVKFLIREISATTRL